MSARLKREFLELLKRDEEFRYAVLGYLGISEVLKRLDEIAEEQARLVQELVKLREDFRQLHGEQVKLAQEQVAMRQEQAKLTSELVKLREDFNRMMLRVERIEARLDRVERTLEKLTLDIEEEAREVVAYRLREAGIEVEIGRLELPGIELDLYGVSGDVCVLGEAAVRVGVGRIRSFLRKVQSLERMRPELLRPKRILVVYVSHATGEAIKEAEREGIWLLKATKDIVKPALLGA